MNDTLSLLNLLVSENGIAVTLVMVEAGIILFFLRSYTQSLRESNEAIVGELKRTIQTVKQYYEDCSEERRELYRRLGERARHE